MNKIKSEDSATYNATTADDKVIQSAIDILHSRLRHPSEVFENPQTVKQYLYLQLASEPAEVFCCLFLDNRHQLIAFDRMFNGTIDGASVHPREVVRACIAHNAAAVVFSHNHPSGISEPSRADIQLTKRLTDTLALIDVRVLDHIVVGDSVDNCTSFAERGLI